MGNFLRTFHNDLSHPDKSAILKDLMYSQEPFLAIGAHDGLTGYIGESCGFDAIWASSFEISASFGLPDASLISLDKYIEIVRAINNAIHIPLIVDCDSGFGDVINTIKMAYDMEKAGIAGICIEDNFYPKKCSFYEGKRELVSAKDHANRIRAIKQVLRNKNLVVIARTEALIAGHGMEEALSRAKMYSQAGADAILIHSKATDPKEVFTFAKEWKKVKQKIPLVCVPTTYYSTDVQTLASHGYQLIIFANHGLRASIKAMKKILSKIRKSGTTKNIEHEIENLKGVFELIDQPILKAIESQMTK